MMGSLVLVQAMAEGKGQNKVTLCHVNQGTGEEKTITVGAPAVGKHLANHEGDHVGECKDDPDSCVFNEECSSGQYCAKPVGANPLSEGLCRSAPPACGGIVDPVCGVDGISYSSECHAAQNGVNVAHLGVCAPS